MGDFLAFRKMITPAVIQIFFWLGVIVCVVAGLGILDNSEMLAATSPVSPTLTAVLVLVVGPLLVRIYCELLMVLFRIYESLRAIELSRVREPAPPAL
jgi:hypothetical protein